MDQYIGQLEAVKNFDQVMEVNFQLTLTNKKLTRKQRKVSKKNSALKKSLYEMEEELKGLRGEIKVKIEGLQKKEFETTRLENRVDELENLRTIVDGMTFREAEKALLKAMEDEVDTRAHESFKEMKTKWDTSDKPKEVFNEAVNQIEIIIKTFRKPGPQYFLTELVDKELPKKVEEIITSDVDKRFDEEFQKQVESKSDEKAREKLEFLKNVEWPQWFKANIDPNVRGLEKKIVDNALSQLKGPWTIHCGKCNEQQNVVFTSREVADLMMKNYVVIDCQNPDCISLFRRHRMRLTLETLLYNFPYI